MIAATVITHTIALMVTPLAVWIAVEGIRGALGGRR